MGWWVLLMSRPPPSLLLEAITRSSVAVVMLLRPIMVDYLVTHQVIIHLADVHVRGVQGGKKLPFLCISSKVPVYFCTTLLNGRKR